MNSLALLIGAAMWLVGAGMVGFKQWGQVGVDDCWLFILSANIFIACHFVARAIETRKDSK